MLAVCLAAGLLAVAGLPGSPAVAAPSPADVQKQQRQAAMLRARVQQEAARLRTEQAVVGALSARANAALDYYQRAREQLVAAEASLRHRERLLESARRAAVAARNRLLRYVVQTYQTRSSGESLAATQMLLDDAGPGDLEQRLSYLHAVGDFAVRIVVASRLAAAAERRATQDARAAAVAHREAEETAAAAKRRAEALVAAQRALIARLAAGLNQTRVAATAAQQKAVELKRARAVALERAGRIAAQLQRRAVVTQRVGRRPARFPVFVVTGSRCAGGKLSGYPNGQLPTSALCPLWGAPGQLLRSDAAAAFERLSKSFAETFSRPICVTDSYRALSDQVRLYGEKPGLAAIPGTSQHGWGRAVDLCGGVQTFGTPEHLWLALHAPRFGWFHPSWAGPGGSRPEPWHFEYGG